MINIKKRMNPYVFGLIGFMSMVLLYIGLLWFTTDDIVHSFIFFTQKWFFLVPIFVGFGIQMTLFQKLRIRIHENKLAMAGASAGMNTVAMVACCAHHFAEILPILGFAGAAIFMTKYQNAFLAIGAVMNIIGIWYMWLQLKKQKSMKCVVSSIT